MIMIMILANHVHPVILLVQNVHNLQNYDDHDDHNNDDDDDGDDRVEACTHYPSMLKQFKR